MAKRHLRLVTDEERKQINDYVENQFDSKKTDWPLFFIRVVSLIILGSILCLLHVSVLFISRSFHGSW